MLPFPTSREEIALSSHPAPRSILAPLLAALIPLCSSARAAVQEASAPPQQKPPAPIQWQTWSAAAFDRAASEKKPIFLFLSTPWTRANLWAEEKVLADPEVTDLLNTRWIPILVNRDRRPDIDLRYQVAVNAVRAGETGWPLMAMMIDTGELLTGGGSFPLEDRRGQQGLRSQLRAMADAYPLLREAAAGNRDVVSRAFQREKTPQRSSDLAFAIVEEIGRSVLESLNHDYGGLGGAPRMPTPFAMELAGTLYQRTGNEAWLDALSTTLRGMERGAIYDRVGGGFHRSTLDEAWRLPEYEKLITYNATILQNYLMAWEATRDETFRIPAERTTDFILRTLTDPDGGFYVGQWAAAKADDPKGTWYAWGYEEFFQAVPKDLSELARAHFNVTEKGDLVLGPPPRTTLYLAAPRADTAARLKIEPARLAAGESAILEALARAREKKPAPPIERAIYIDSCAAGALGMLEAARVLGRDDARRAALAALDRMLAALPPDGPLRHRLSPPPDPAADPPLALDHVMLARALVAAYELTRSPRYLEGALEVSRRAIALFWDPAEGGLFDVAEDPSARGYLSIRRRLQNDIAYPSLPSLSARLFQRLALHTGDESWQERGATCLKGLVSNSRLLDFRQSGMALALESYIRPPTRYLVVAPPGDRRGDQLEAAARKVFDPGHVVARLDPEKDRKAIPPLPGRRPSGAFLVACSGTRCGEPVADPSSVNGRSIR